MSCKRYKKALTEAAAVGDRWPIGPAGEHVTSCSPCREFFLKEQALFAAVDTAAQQISKAEVPPSLFAGVHAAIALEPACRRSRTLLWAPVAASILFAVTVTAWIVRNRSSAPSELQTIAAVSVAPTGTSETLRESHSTVLSRIKHHKSSNVPFRTADFHPLVPPGQSAQVGRLIDDIRAAAIDASILVTQPNQELQIPPIVILPLTVDVANEESNGQSGISEVSVSEPSLDTNRRTR